MPYRFKKEYRDAVISIPALRLDINRFNLTDELARKIIKKFPQLAHNFEEVPEEVLPAEEPKVVEEIPAAAEVQEIVIPAAEESVEAEEVQEVATQESVEERINRIAAEDSKPKTKKPRSKGQSNKGKQKKKP